MFALEGERAAGLGQQRAPWRPDRRCASRCSVTLSYSWSFESQPSTTSQKPKPLSSAEKNLLAIEVFAAQDAVDVEDADLDVRQPAFLDDGSRLCAGAHLVWLHARSLVGRRCARIMHQLGML